MRASSPRSSSRCAATSTGTLPCTSSRLIRRGARQAILGVVFDLFKSRDEAYKVFFLVSAAIHAASAFLYLVVHQKQKEARAEVEREKARRQGGGRMEYTKQLAATRVENYRRQAGGSAKEPLLGSE